jgi:putative copper export protein
MFVALHLTAAAAWAGGMICFVTGQLSLGVGGAPDACFRAPLRGTEPDH